MKLVKSTKTLVLSGDIRWRAWTSGLDGRRTDEGVTSEGGNLASFQYILFSACEGQLPWAFGVLI
jgi:hypothetical protein